jgi:hypothetical protein
MLWKRGKKPSEGEVARTPVLLATHEAEIRRIQARPYLENTQQKQG